jgi:hypothetical protein
MPEDADATLQQSWLMQGAARAVVCVRFFDWRVTWNALSGCALAWSKHWLPFEPQNSQTASSSSPSPSLPLLPSSADVANDLSLASNTPWAVRYARSTIIDFCSSLETLSSEPPPSSALSWGVQAAVSPADWSRACDHKVFIQFVCGKVHRRIQQHSDDIVFGSNMQLFSETLDACCELQKNIFDICGAWDNVAVPSALAAFCDIEDMFESWL